MARGAPDAAVVGGFGWRPLPVEVWRGTDDGRTLAIHVFKYAVHSRGSWAHVVKQQLQSSGGLLLADCGVMPGALAAQLQWKRSFVQHPLECEALRQYRSIVVALVSIACISRWARRSARHRASDAVAVRFLRGQTGIAGTKKKSKKYFLLMWGL